MRETICVRGGVSVCIRVCVCVCVYERGSVRERERVSKSWRSIQRESRSCSGRVL